MAVAECCGRWKCFPINWREIEKAELDRREIRPKQNGTVIEHWNFNSNSVENILIHLQSTPTTMGTETILNYVRCFPFPLFGKKFFEIHIRTSYVIKIKFSLFAVSVSHFIFISIDSRSFSLRYVKQRRLLNRVWKSHRVRRRMRSQRR